MQKLSLTTLCLAMLNAEYFLVLGHNFNNIMFSSYYGGRMVSVVGQNLKMLTSLIEYLTVLLEYISVMGSCLTTPLDGIS